jgi:hypothetical protein
MSVDRWFADVLLDTDWSPLPTFTPGLMSAEAFTSVLLTPTFASTPTLGLALMLRSRSVLVCANAPPAANARATAL